MSGITKFLQSGPMPWPKMRVYSLILLVTCMVKSPMVYAQDSRHAESHRECVNIHLDKALYVAGESMRYKVYLLDLETENRVSCSSILYFTLAAVHAQVTVTWRINLTDEPVSGNFMLPSDLPSGQYVLTAYTNWMRNGLSDALFSRSLLIVNLAETTPDAFMIGEPLYKSANSWHSLSSPDVSLRVETSKPRFAVKENVRLEINLVSPITSIRDAELSISVSAETPFQELLDGQQNDTIPLSNITDGANLKAEILKAPSGNSSSGNEPSTCKYLIEDRGFILAGQIKSRKDNAPLNNGKILLATVDSLIPGILFSRTDQEGRFQFFLDRHYDNRQLILQLADPFNSADYLWEFDQKSMSFPTMEKKNRVIVPGEIDYLNRIKDLRIIEAIYSNQMASESKEETVTRLNYFRPAQRIIYPHDYSDMVNFKEIADNIIPELRFGFRNDEFFMLVLSNRINEWRKNHLVLLNGIPFTDLKYISTLGTKEIERIEVISANYLMGDLTLPGVISIFTYAHEIPESYLKKHTAVFRNTVIANDAKGSAVIQSSSGLSKTRLPDFGSTLYWNPSVQITSGKPMVIEFPASLLTGKYIVVIEGLSHGKYPVRAAVSFEVIE